MDAVDDRPHQLLAREVALRKALVGRLDSKLEKFHFAFLP